jgi:hypothetical protein
MATSLLACDKYAILVSGSAETRYIKDLENVYKTIRHYYGYPEDHIWVILGNIGTGAPDTAIIPNSRVMLLDDPMTILADFNSFFGDFINAAKVAPTLLASLPVECQNSRKTGDLNTAFIYFTGIGTDAGDDYQFVIGRDNLSADVIIDPITLALKLSDGDFCNNCHVQVVMQQSYAGGFEENFWGLVSIGSGSWTYACQYNETTAGDATNGSEFTFRWTKGLQMSPALSTTHSGKFADEIILTGDNAADFLISVERAKEFVSWYANTAITGTPGYEYHGGQNHYLGKPQLLIRDGDPVWISPDLFLRHPDPPQSDMSNPGSQYVVDTLPAEYNNWINVVVRNHGTHPIRKYDLGALVFLSGCSGAGNSDDITLNNTSLGGILCPVPCTDPVKPNDGTIIRSYTHEFLQIHFDNQNHRCMRARAKFSDGVPFDFTTWTWGITTMDDEAQRNTDFWEANKSSSGGTETGTEPVTGTRKGMIRIENMFKLRRKFYLVLPPEIDKLSPILKARWSVVKKEKAIDLEPVSRMNGRVRMLEFDLLPGKFADITFELKTTPKFKLEKELQLHFPITMKGHWKLGKKWPRNFYVLPDQALIGGVTLVIQQGSADLFGNILLKGEKPSKKTQFVIHTQGKTQIAKIIVAPDGSFSVKGIDPGIYRYYATDGTNTSPDKLLVLKNKDIKKVLIELSEKVKPSLKKTRK